VTTRHERREENQRTFQKANQRLHDVLETQLPEPKPVAFVCECADDQCLARVEVGLAQWRAVADQSDYFLIVAGHPRVEGEQVIDTLGPFEIVCKADV
jgi:hypothetical protein